MEFETELFKDLEKAFRETDQRMKAMSEEADRRRDEADQRMKAMSEKADQRRDEADRHMKAMDEKADRRRDEADRHMKAMGEKADQRMKAMSEETDRRRKKSDQLRDELAQQMKVTDRKIKEVGKQLGRFGNEAGFFVQELIRPGLVRLLRKHDIDVSQVSSNVEVSKHGLAAEFDLIAANGDEVVFVEVKKKLKTEDIKEHIDRIKKVPTLFPSYKDYKIMGAVAGISVTEDVAAYAQKQGFFVIAPSGDDITFLNTPNFEPKFW